MRLHIRVYRHHRGVCTESWLWEKNPLPHQGIKPTSAACRSNALPTGWHPCPQCGDSMNTFVTEVLLLLLLFWIGAPQHEALSVHSLPLRSQDSLLVRAPDSWSKGCEFKSQQGQPENFLLQSQLCVLALIRCPFHPPVTAVARKSTQSFCQKCRWQVTPKQAYTLDPSKSEWADYASVQARCGCLSGNELTRNSSGNPRLQLSQLTEPLWTDPGQKSEISLRELISTL